MCQSSGLVIHHASLLNDHLDAVRIVQDLFNLCSHDAAVGMITFDVLRVRRVPHDATLIHLFHSLYRSAAA